MGLRDGAGLVDTTGVQEDDFTALWEAGQKNRQRSCLVQTDNDNGKVKPACLTVIQAVRRKTRPTGDCWFFFQR